MQNQTGKKIKIAVLCEENKVKEAEDKWKDIKSKYNNCKLHMIGRLQSNKVKQALSIFDYIQFH